MHCLPAEGHTKRPLFIYLWIPEKSLKDLHEKSDGDIAGDL